MLRIGETISNLSKSNLSRVFKTLLASGNDENEGGEHQRRLDSVLNSYGFIGLYKVFSPRGWRLPFDRIVSTTITATALRNTV